MLVDMRQNLQVFAVEFAQESGSPRPIGTVGTQTLHPRPTFADHTFLAARNHVGFRDAQFSAFMPKMRAEADPCVDKNAIAFCK